MKIYFVIYNFLLPFQFNKSTVMLWSEIKVFFGSRISSPGLFSHWWSVLSVPGSPNQGSMQTNSGASCVLPDYHIWIILCVHANQLSSPNISKSSPVWFYVRKKIPIFKSDYSNRNYSQLFFEHSLNGRNSCSPKFRNHNHPSNG